MERGVPAAQMPRQAYPEPDEPVADVPEVYSSYEEDETYPEAPLPEPPEEYDSYPEEGNVSMPSSEAPRESPPQPAPVEAAPPSEAASTCAPPAGNSRELWNRIRAAVMNALPLDVQMLLQDEERVTGFLDGNAILVETQNDFQAKRFQRQDVILAFQAAGRNVLGHDVRVQVRERQTESRVTRRLDDLRQFKEVHFISE